MLVGLNYYFVLDGFFFNLKLEEENGLFFDWEDLRKYFSDESNFEKWNNRRKRGNKGR